MEKHYVTFLSPGTFVHEQRTVEIDSWNVEKAKEMARDIVERHGARPFAFEFSTRRRGPEDFDSREVAVSSRYYLGGKVETIEEVRARNDPNEKILLSNMEYNAWNRILVNTNSYRVTQPLGPDDVVLDF